MKIDEIKNEFKKLLEQIDKFTGPTEKVISACDNINNSWSGSDLVGHADLFYGNFDAPSHGKRFSIEWGLTHGVPDGWNKKSNDEVLQKIESDSGTNLKDLDNNADLIAAKFEKLRKETIINFSGFSKEASEEIEKFNLQTKIDIFNQYWKRQIMTRDSEALFAGRQVPTHKYYWATVSFIIGITEQIEEFLYLVDKIIAQNKSSQRTIQDKDIGITAYIDKNTLLRLSRIENDDFDLSKLIALCNELNDNYSLKNYHSCAMLLRAMVDHIPPIFRKTSFADVCLQHEGRSFKNIMKPLNDTAKKIGDDYLHTQISKKVLAVTKTQVSFQANLDVLLNEVAAILEQK